MYFPGHFLGVEIVLGLGLRVRFGVQVARGKVGVRRETIVFLCDAKRLGAQAPCL